MTQADHIAEDTRLELNQLWMLPLILFQMICNFFQNEQAFIRKHRLKGSVPKDWEDHILALGEAEWAIDAIKTEGARRLLAGEPIGFNTIRIPAPPDDWQPIVEDAADLMRRFEAVASFHADPDKFIRRHAERLTLLDPLRHSASPNATSPAFQAVEANGTMFLVLVHRSDCLPMSSDRRGHRAAMTIARSCAAEGGGWLNIHPP